MGSYKMESKKFNPEEEVVGDYKPLVELPDVKTETGEEGEDTLLELRTRFYRWDDSQWKERGTGAMKFLKSKESGLTRVLLRQDQTNKIRANFFVTADPLCVLYPMDTNEKCFILDCFDCSDDEAKITKFCVKMRNMDEKAQFKEAFETAKKSNA